MIIVNNHSVAVNYLLHEENGEMYTIEVYTKKKYYYIKKKSNR
jgi:hypothetical protein